MIVDLEEVTAEGLEVAVIRTDAAMIEEVMVETAPVASAVVGVAASATKTRETLVEVVYVNHNGIWRSFAPSLKTFTNPTLRFKAGTVSLMLYTFVPRGVSCRFLL